MTDRAALVPARAFADALGWYFPSQDLIDGLEPGALAKVRGVALEQLGLVSRSFLAKISLFSAVTSPTVCKVGSSAYTKGAFCVRGGGTRPPGAVSSRPALGLRRCACRTPEPQQRHDSALPKFCRSVESGSVLRFTGCSSDPMALHPCNMPTGDRSPLLCRSWQFGRRPPT
jgi:hypothetical protein